MGSLLAPVRDSRPEFLEPELLVEFFGVAIEADSLLHQERQLRLLPGMPDSRPMADLALDIFQMPNDGRAWTCNTATGTDELDGEQLEQALLDRFSVTFGDWTEHYESVEVLKRVQVGDDSVLLVRVVPREAPGSTMFIDEASGLVRLTYSLAQLPGLGIVGVQTRYGDFRDIGGMQLPFRAVAKFASKLIGRVVTQLEESEAGVEVSEGTFAPPTAPDE